MKRITAIMMVVCMLLCGCAMPDVGETQDQQMPESIDTSTDTSRETPSEMEEGFFEKDGQLYLSLAELETVTLKDDPNATVKVGTLYDFSARFGSVSEALDKISRRDFTKEQLAQITRFPKDAETGARMVYDYTDLDRVRVSPELKIKDVLWSYRGCYLMCEAKNSDSNFTVNPGLSLEENNLVCAILVQKAEDIVIQLFENEDNPNITDTTLYGLPAKQLVDKDYYYKYLSFEDESRKVVVQVQGYDGSENHYYYITYKGEDRMIVIRTKNFKTEPTLDWVLSLAELVPATKQ